MSMQKVPVSFLNGFSGREGVLGVLSFPNMLSGDVTFCRFFSFSKNDGRWGHRDFDFDCKSLTYRMDPSTDYRGWWILGKNGQVVELTAEGPRVEQIIGAGLNRVEPYGYVEAIKNIGGELYVCGYGRQVYKREAGNWVSIADDILTRETATGFFDIDGTDGSHVYAVGWKGEIYFYDGAIWRADDSPTNAHLASVRCLGSDRVWICGNGGVVLHGSYGQWQMIQDNEFSGNWYCIEEYGGKIYLAGNGVLAYVDGSTIRMLDPGLNKAITTNRLHTKDGLLWSIGEKDILVFDGKTWKEILHPDNI